MANVSNSLTESKKKPKFSMILQTDSIQKLINNTLGEPKKAQRFITAISSAVATNQALQECDGFSIINSALLGETLNLSPSPQLGQYYMVPYNDKKKGKVATFQLGYKGYIQLAIRSGEYKRINVLLIKEGELINYDPLNEELEVNLMKDELARENAKTIGYYAMFELVNGFKKTMYWSKEKMEAHALKYSQGYKVKKGYTFWEKDFDAMATKTMLRQLISKWGIMSIELQTAFENDMTFKDKQDGEAFYVDVEETPNINSDVVVNEQLEVPAQEAQQEAEPQQDLL